MFSKFIKMKNCHPDKLYEILLDRYFKEKYNHLTKAVIHHTMTYRDGKIVAALELHFINEIVFLNADIFIKDNNINIFKLDKIVEYLK